MLPTGGMYLGLLLLLTYGMDELFPGFDPGMKGYGALILGFAAVFALAVYISVGRNYNRVVVDLEEIRIVNRLPGFRKDVTLPLGDIDEIVLGQDQANYEHPRLHDLVREVYIHPERKWLEIRTGERCIRWNCYGFLADLPAGDAIAPTYKDLYLRIKEMERVPVRWAG